MAEPSTAPDSHSEASRRSKGPTLAIASLICGIGGLLTCGLSAVVGVILGIVALVKLNKAGATSGKGLAIAGLVVSALMTFAVLPEIGFLIFFRETIKEWVADTWEEDLREEQQEQDNFFGGPLDRLGLPRPRLRPAALPALVDRRPTAPRIQP